MFLKAQSVTSLFSLIFIYNFLYLRINIKKSKKKNKDDGTRRVSYAANVSYLKVPNTSFDPLPPIKDEGVQHERIKVQFSQLITLQSLIFSVLLSLTPTVPDFVVKMLVDSVHSFTKSVSYQGPGHHKLEPVYMFYQGIIHLVNLPSNAILLLTNREDIMNESVYQRSVVPLSNVTSVVSSLNCCGVWNERKSSVINFASVPSSHFGHATNLSQGPRNGISTIHSVPKSTIKTYSNRHKTNYLVTSSSLGILGTSPTGKLTSTPNNKPVTIKGSNGVKS